MIFVGDYFALGFVIMLLLFFMDGKSGFRYMSTAAKLFVGCLLSTGISAVLDLLSVYILDMESIPDWAGMLVNSLYFISAVAVTSCIAMYLFTKLLEHTHNRYCMKNARIGLALLFGIYLVAVVVNLGTGWLFSFENGQYSRGPLNSLGYMITIAQMGLVIICYLRNRQNASSAMRRALLQTFPLVPMCMLVHRVVPDIMLNSFVMALVCTVLFLTFLGQRQGVHSLTRLNDRHRFFDNLDSRLKSGELFQVFIINIKDYGVINQKYGHMIGDEVLYHFAFALEKLIKGSEAFHMNGTVFALIMPYVNQHAAEEHTRSLLGFLESGIEYSGERIRMNYVLVEHVSGSDERDTGAFYEKLEYASAKAYRQKDRYIRYTPELGLKMERNRYLIDRMQSIDRENGFRVWFQPIFNFADQKFSGVEALVRMVEKDGTIVSSGEFIPLAEQTGMLMPITWFVLEESCRFLAEHDELGIECVTINLPLVQMLEPGFGVRLNSLLDSYGIDHSRIGLEITERAIMDNLERANQVMWKLCEDGYRFYLDDFGEGFSNFNCLMQLPFQVIKLDAALISRDLERKYQDCWSLTQTLANFLHNIGLQVVAEGVERLEDAARLREQGVDRIQGYAYARPMDEEHLLEFYHNT